MNETYVIFGIDMETDVGSFTPFYETTKSGTQKILNIFESHGFKGTFFFTGECAKENPDVVKMVIDSGHEVGAHSLFHETVGDELFPIPGVKPLLPEEVPNRIRLGLYAKRTYHIFSFQTYYRTYGRYFSNESAELSHWSITTRLAIQLPLSGSYLPWETF